jgi:hypothetical protein
MGLLVEEGKQESLFEVLVEEMVEMGVLSFLKLRKMKIRYWLTSIKKISKLSMERMERPKINMEQMPKILYLPCL